MEKYLCTICGWIYAEITGYPQGGIPAGTPFSKLPKSWSCPFCSGDKEKFERMADE